MRLPDLALLLHRDGTVAEFLGGEAVPELCTQGLVAGQTLDAAWPGGTAGSDGLAAIVQPLLRRALATRSTVDADCAVGERRYQLRVTPRGPDRVWCQIRPAAAGAPLQLAPGGPGRGEQRLDRRGFLRELRQVLSNAVLRELPLGIAVIHLDGLSDIARVLDAALAEQLMGELLARLDMPGADEQTGNGCIGQLGEGVIALAIASTDRAVIEKRIAHLCANLARPVTVGDAAFHLTPCAGVAILGQDASSARTLLSHARTAASDARRGGGRRVHFFTDTLRLRSLARLDIARELGEAIERGEIGLRYRPRHDLRSGQQVARVAYLCWTHPLRGEIRPSEFLRLAETTGLARALSRSVLDNLRRDLAALGEREAWEMRLSFGALRHHVLHEDFVGDIRRTILDAGVSPQRLELRIAERTFINTDPDALSALSQLGVRLVIDEVGRQVCSFTRLAAAAPSALQLDRAFATQVQGDARAMAVARMTESLARALGAEAIAPGVDDEAQLGALRALGYSQGTGDWFAAESRAVLSEIPANRRLKF